MVGINGIPELSDGFGGANQRRAGRFRIEGRSCAFGRIEDISALGMRCRFNGRGFGRSRVFRVQLPTNAGQVEATVRLVWERRFGLMKRIVGLEFVDPGEDVRRAAMKVASETAADFRLKRR